MNILITGLNGFVGQNLVAKLSAKHSIFCLSLTENMVAGVEKIYTWDDFNKGALPEVDAIIHLAGKAHDTKNRSKAEEYFMVNKDLTVSLYKYLLN